MHWLNPIYLQQFLHANSEIRGASSTLFPYENLVSTAYEFSWKCEMLMTDDCDHTVL